MRTSRSASSEPRLSNLLIAIRSAKSSMSIFSSCVAAPYSAVITYSETSECSTISVSDWPIPGRLDDDEVEARRLADVDRLLHVGDSARLDWRVASERM